MKILALAFIMALMFAMIGADLAEDEERYRLYRNKFSQYPNKGGYYPYPSQSDSQEYPEPILYGRK